MSAIKEFDEACKELIETHRQLNDNVERLIDENEKTNRLLDYAPLIFGFWLLLFALVAYFFLL